MAAVRHAVTPRCATAGFARRLETSQRTMLAGCMPTSFRREYGTDYTGPKPVVVNPVRSTPPAKL
jgi:hypothetical protein